MFWYARDYANLVERARRADVTIPLIPGILPTSDPLRLLRIHELTGVPVPRDFLRSLVDASDSKRYRRGVEFSATLMNNCVETGAPGLHMYTLHPRTSPARGEFAKRSSRANRGATYFLGPVSPRRTGRRGL